MIVHYYHYHNNVYDVTNTITLLRKTIRSANNTNVSIRSLFYSFSVFNYSVLFATLHWYARL